MVEGNSIRSTARLTGCAEHDHPLLVNLGKRCRPIRTGRCATCPRPALRAVIWAFCYAKAKNVPEPKRGEFGYGDVWNVDRD